MHETSTPLPSRTVFYDFETTGLDSRVHQIIQAAAVVVDRDWKEVETWERKLQFDLSTASPKALEVNSYDPDVWSAETVLHLQARTEFKDLLNRHSHRQKINKAGRSYRVAVLAGHNVIKLDSRFLRSWFKGNYVPADLHQLDTLVLAAWWKSCLPVAEQPLNLRLTTLAEYFDISTDNAHDALADVRITVQVARRLLADISRLVSTTEPHQR